MKELLDAQQTYFAHASSGPLSDTITGGLNEREAGGGAAMPYVVYDVIGGPATLRYGAAVFSEFQIQYTSWAQAGGGVTGSRVALNNIETFIAAWDEKTFTLASGQMIQNARQGSPFPVEDDMEKDESGNPLCGWAVVYSFATTGK